MINIVDYKIKSAEKKFDNLIKKEDLFKELYEMEIFEIFVKIRPYLLNRRTNVYEQWEKVFGNSFKQMPESSKGCLFCAIEEDGGIYRFPPEYYE